MSRFAATHKIDLSFVGGGWDGAFIEVTIPSFGESHGFVAMPDAEPITRASQSMEYMQDHFVIGKAPQQGKLVDLSREDVPDLPVNAIAKLSAVLINGEDILDPKS